MKRKIGVAGTLLAATFWLAGCALWQGVGPCYGVGCRAGLMAPHAAQQSAQAKPANTKKSKSFASSLMIWRHSKTADSTPANPPSTPATSPTAASQGGGK